LERFPRYAPVSVDRRVDLTRHAIEEAAMHSFRARGYAATTMDSVAALAGTSPRTLYRYYGSKGELFAEILAVGVARFVDELSLIIRRVPLREAIIIAFEDIIVDATGDGQELVRQAAADEKMWGHVIAATSRLQPVLSTVLRSAMTVDRTHLCAPTDDLIWDVRAGVVLSTMSTVFKRWATADRQELRELAEIAVDAVLPGLGPDV
jgi:AcrR family transcriptional regulator